MLVKIPDMYAVDQPVMNLNSDRNYQIFILVTVLADAHNRDGSVLLVIRMGDGSKTEPGQVAYEEHVMLVSGTAIRICSSFIYSFNRVFSILVKVFKISGITE